MGWVYYFLGSFGTDIFTKGILDQFTILFGKHRIWCIDITDATGDTLKAER